MKEFADDNFKFDRNVRKFSKWLENTVGKGEIALYEQFLLFPQCFQKSCTRKNQGFVWERDKTMDRGERELNPVAITITSPLKVYWPSQEIPATSCTLPTEQWCAAV